MRAADGDAPEGTTQAQAALLGRLGLGPDGLRAFREVLEDVSDACDRDLLALFDKVAAGDDLLGALGLPDGTVDMLYAQAYARFNAGRLPEALQLFGALVLLAPKVRDHWLGAGICLRMAGNHEAAGMAFDTALALAPDCPAVAFHRLELACHRTRWHEARVEIERFGKSAQGSLQDRLAPEVQRYAALVAGQGT